MRKFSLVFILTVLAFAAVQRAAAQQAAEVTFSYERQSGSASNQFAVWIENPGGQHVKTLYVTQWTARGGYSRRPASIPLWVKQSGLSSWSKAQADAVSAATPRTGPVTYAWDGTDSKGAPVPAGNYTVIIEGNLRWENMVYCRVPIVIGSGPASAQVNAEYVSAGDRDATAERSMISGVKVRVLR